MSNVIGEVDSKLKDIIADAKHVGTGSSKPDRSTAIGTVILSIVLVALVWACFGRTLTTYFLADDFGEIAYVSKICAGRWDMFLANWTGNYMQIPGMAVYRPLLLVSLIADFLIWKGNAVGYYLTNMLFVTGDTLLLFFVCRQLTNKWRASRSLCASFFAAALFAVNPLHCESTSWVVGRVDTACCLFYLSALLFFLKGRENRKKSFIAASVVCFWCAMFFKEMAIGLPILISALVFLFPPATVPSEISLFALRNRIVQTIRESAPFWISTILYFGLRFVTLGTLLGGYSGAIGDGQADSAIRRWLDLSTYQRVIFPFAASIFQPTHLYPKIMLVSIAALCAIVIYRALRKEIPLPYVGFVAAWLMTAALPIYKLWGIGLDLEGARFCFFLTLPLSAALPLIVMSERVPRSGVQHTGASPDHVLPPSKASSDDRADFIFPALILVCMVCVLYKTSLATNAVWVHAGKEVKSVLTSAISVSDAQKGAGKLVVLGIPKRNSSAHMIYNGATFKTMLEPPFASKVYSERFLTFDPMFFGPDEYINSARLKQTLDEPGVQGACMWHGPNSGIPNSAANGAFFPLPLKQLDSTRNHTAFPLALPITLSSSAVQPYTDGHATVTPVTNGALFRSVADGDGLRFSNLAVNPFEYDFVEFGYRFSKGTSGDSTFTVKWKGEEPAGSHCLASRSVGAQSRGARGLIRIPVSHYWHWYACGKISEIEIMLPPGKDVELTDVRLISDNQSRPTISVPGLHEDGMGVFISPARTNIFVDASKIPGVQKLQIECSKPNYFFDQFEESKQSTAVLKTVTVDAKTVTFDVTKDFCPKNEYCEVRVRAVDANLAPLGEYSEPVIIYANL